jgi:hypothetical protein
VAVVLCLCCHHIMIYVQPKVYHDRLLLPLLLTPCQCSSAATVMTGSLRVCAVPLCCDACRRHAITMYVEPKVYQDLLDQGRVLPQQQQQQQALQNSSSSSSSSSGSGCLTGMLVNTGAASKDGAAAAAAAAAGGGGGSGALVSFSSWPVPPGGQSRFSSSSSGAAGASAFSTAAPAGPGSGGVQGAGLVKTWQPEVTVCQQQQQQQQQGEGGSSSSSVVSVSDLIPEEVAQQLDLVLVLGGDGTVLWTCHIFGNRWGGACCLVCVQASNALLACGQATLVPSLCCVVM